MQDRQLKRDEKPDGLYRGSLLAALVTASILTLVLLPPFIGLPWRGAIMGGFSMVCHQIPARSPHLDGVALAVCHRCFGVYAGLFLATILFAGLWRLEPLLNRHARWFMLLALVPAAIDWALGASGLWLNTPGSRAFTGGAFGMVAGLYLARALVQMTSRPAPPSDALLVPGAENAA